jgi:hypothetical protein
MIMSEEFNKLVTQAPEETDPKYSEWLKAVQDKAASEIIDKILAERENKFIPE